MKILIAGDWHSELHEEAIFKAFEQLNHQPFKFSWYQYFLSKGWAKRFTRPFLKVQNKFMFGPSVTKLNNDLFDFAIQVQPDVIFIYRGTHVYVKTVLKIQKALKKTLVIGYNNDDPFAPQYPWWQWRHFLASVPQYDLTLAYRKHNIAEYLAIGAKRVELLRSWFIPERNYSVQLTDAEKEQYACDVVFIGHYENDGRLACLEEIARQGWRLRIYGPGYEWDPIIRHSPLLAEHLPVRLVWGDDYNRALCGAKIALCFFSQLNRDTYTRRCFEIPASGVVLLSKYTDDMASLFQVDEEVAFFKDAKDMCVTIDSLLTNDVKRHQIAKSGTKRVWDDGHDVVSRMQKVLDLINEVKGK
jgi:spore maturation protein CgeB